MSTVAEHPEIAAEPDFGEPLFEQRVRITVDQYHRMAELGFLGEAPRCELIEGVIVAKMSKNPPHVLSSDLIDELFHRIVPQGFFVSMGNPLSIAERDSEPEPDAQVFRGSPRDYRGRRRTQRDAVLVVEISDTSYRMDRYRKWVTYAGAGVPIYWILDLTRNRLEVHTSPTGSGDDAHYARCEILGPLDEVPLIVEGREAARFPVREILP